MAETKTRYAVVSPTQPGTFYEHDSYNTLEEAQDEARRLTEVDREFGPDEACVHIFRITQELVETVTADVASYQAEVA